MSIVRLGAAAAAVLALLAALPGGGPMFAVAVALWGVVVLVDLAGRQAAAGQRPLLPASALGAVGAPAAATAAGAPGWERFPMLIALMLLAGFAAALLAPRKRQITVTLGATVFPALLVGLGTAGMVVLRSATAGFRWTAGLLLLTAVPVLAGAVAARVRDAGADVPVRVVVAGAAGGALLLGLQPPFGAGTTAVVAVGGLGAGWAAAALAAAMPARPAAGDHWSAPAILRTLAAPLIAAPVVAFVALAAQI